MAPIKKRKKRKKRDDEENDIEFDIEEPINLFGP